MFRRRGFIKLLRKKRALREKVQKLLEESSVRLGDWAIAMPHYSWLVVDCRRRYWKPVAEYALQSSARSDMMNRVTKDAFDMAGGDLAKVPDIMRSMRVKSGGYL